MTAQGPGRIDHVEFQGLVSAPGLLARANASCIEAINWEFPAPGLMRKRRGFQKPLGNAGGPVWKLLTSRLMGNNLLAAVGVGSGSTQLRYGDGSVALPTIAFISGISNLTRPADTRTQMAVCQRNHYVTATEGVARVESSMTAASQRMAGMPRSGAGYFSGGGVVAAGTLNVTGSVFLAAGYARAYRMTVHRKDNDGIELSGAPTGRIVVANQSYTTGYTGATACVFVTFTLPKELNTTGTSLTTEYYVRIWGTKSWNEAGGQTGDDECYQLTEVPLTAGIISAGSITFNDRVPDAFLFTAPTLNTNQLNFPPQEAGILNGVVNEDAPPPQANDVAYWQDVMWYGDITPFSDATVAMVGLPADGDTVTVQIGASSVLLTARDTPTTTLEFKRFTTGPSTDINIRQTAYALVGAINRNLATSGIDAFPVSTGTSLPGLIRLVSRIQGQNVALTPSATTSWLGLGGYQLGTYAVPVNYSNTIAFSKPLRADSVPVVNLLSAGPKDGRVLRIFPFKDMLLVFTDYGIFKVTGRTFADFSVYPLDLGYRLIGREMVALCDEKVYAWCYEGIIEIDGGGITVISTPIEPTIEQAQVLVGSAWRTVFAKLNYAIAYRMQHQVRFFYPQADDVKLYGCYRWLSFDTRTRTWAMGEYGGVDVNGFTSNASCAVVRLTDDLLCYGNWSNTADTYLFLESRTYSSSDYNDVQSDGTTVAITSLATFQYQVPDMEGAMHWQNATITWDSGEYSYRPRPSQADLFMGTETTTEYSTYNVVANQTRIEPSATARRGQRGLVAIQHFLAEYAGVIGVTQAYRGGSRFRRTTTP